VKSNGCALNSADGDEQPQDPGSEGEEGAEGQRRVDAEPDAGEPQAWPVPDAAGNLAPRRILRNAPAGKETSGFGNPYAVAYDTRRREVLVPN